MEQAHGYKIFNKDAISLIREIKVDDKIKLTGLIKENGKYYILKNCRDDQDPYIVVTKNDIIECSNKEYLEIMNGNIEILKIKY